MPHNPDKHYQSAQVFAARRVVKAIKEQVIIDDGAVFFVEVDTMRDIIDPQGAAACLHYLLDEEIPEDLITDPNVVGLLDEFELMKDLPQSRKAVETLFKKRKFAEMLKHAILNLQEEFGEVAGDTPPRLDDYFRGAIFEFED